ncbi:MAG: 5'-nucleotidase [Candidatus Porifericomitaceae bacterium WSBS_2022_MAG_OTU9]
MNKLWQQGTPAAASGKLVIGISSRVLFDLDESHHIYEQQGVEAYRAYQVENENAVLPKGSAFSLVQKLLRINDTFDRELVDVVLLSRNSADTGLRVFNSIEEYGLSISRAAFCSGQSPMRYAGGFGVNLFLSSYVVDVRLALAQGYAAALCLPHGGRRTEDSGLIRFAFDGDGVLFSDQAERINQSEGLERFVETERAAADQPLPGGPFKPFLAALQRLQFEIGEGCPIRTIIITARSAPAHKRVVSTFRAWRINIDEALFLGGIDKADFIQGFAADVFFDDQLRHCDLAPGETLTGHVPFGVMNEQKSDVTA